MKKVRHNYTIMWAHRDDPDGICTGTSVVSAMSEDDAVAHVKKKYGHKKGYAVIRVLNGDFAPEQEHLFCYSNLGEMKEHGILQ